MEYHFTTQNFAQDALQCSEPVFIDFYADWCGPCKMMAPVVERMATELDGKVRVGKINVDEEPELAEKYRVSSIPTFIILKDGVVKDTIVGAVSQTQLMDKIKQILA